MQGVILLSLCNSLHSRQHQSIGSEKCVGLGVPVGWLAGGVESIVFESIRWCAWSFRPSSPFVVAAP